MSRPVVAIVGSVDESRAFDPPIEDAALGREACKELGGALASAGWDLAVYSGSSGFIESDVVSGYVASGKAPAGSIHVYAPFGKGTFPDATQHSEVFELHPDPAGDWEVAFYRSIDVSDGVLLLGGGRATLMTGLIAMARNIPVVAIATFGGAANKMWRRLSSQDGLTEADLAEMAKPWGPGSAQRLVTSLEQQRDQRLAEAQAARRRRQGEARRAQTSLLVAGALLVLAIAGLVAAWQWSPGSGVAIALLAIVPVFAAAGGALIRTSLDVGREWTRAGILGGAAGLITGLLYVASQLLGAPDALNTTDDSDAVGRLLFFVLPIGFVAGLTFDAVYAKLRGSDVSQVNTLETL